MTDAWPQLAFGALLCAAGGWLFVSRWTRARHLLDTPTSKIRSAAQGYVELYGVLSGPETQQGPLTGKPCLWWRFRIEEHRGEGKDKRWRVVEQGQSEACFGFVDGTGECLVDPRGAEVLPVRRDRWSGSARHPRGPVPTGWRAFLGAGRRYRYVEERLQAGDPLYAIGDFRSRGGGHEAHDPAALQGQVIREWKADFAGLLQRFDRDADGRLDEAEWGRVRLAARLEAEDRARRAQAEPLSHRLARPGSGQPFVLSSHGEEVIARRLVWQALGAAALFLAGAVLMAIHLGVRPG